MALRITNNPSSLFGQQQLNKINKALAESLERLSSGRRINKAADDASGMIIANQLASQQAGYGQAIRNAVDAVAITQIGDEALGEATAILQEIRTLAVQAAQDGQSLASRQALQADVDRQLEAYGSTINTTSYNGQQLLTGQFASRSFQVGATPGETVSISIGNLGADQLGTGPAAATTSGATATATVLPAPLTVQDDTATTVESTVAADSTLAAGTVLAAGSSIGATITGTDLAAAITTTEASVLRAGSQLGAGSVIAQGSELGGTVTAAADTTTTAASRLATGTTLTAGTTLAAGTEVTTQFTAGATTYNVGDTLTNDVTLTADLTLTAELTAASGSTFAQNSGLTAGSTVGADLTVAGTATLDYGMTLNAGSTIAAAGGTVIQDNSILGGTATLANDIAVQRDMTLAVGSTIAAASELAAGSSVGGAITAASDLAVNEPMTLAAGSRLDAGTTLAAGTVLTNDISVQGGYLLEAGTELDADVTLDRAASLGASQTVAAGSTIGAGSVVAASPKPPAAVAASGAAAGQTLGATRLNDVDLTTQEGAQQAIAVVDAALETLGRGRAGLGAAQNQLTSSIGNLSTTRVNVASAESTIADVDFAEETMNLKRMQVLMRARAFALSQAADPTKGNILDLLVG